MDQGEVEVFSLPAPVSAVSPVKAVSSVDPSKLFLCDGEGGVARYMKGVKEPVIGLEYLVEVREEGYRTNPKTLCLLCSKDTQASSMVGHVLSASHRLKYLESFFPIAARKFAKVPNLGVWQKATFNHLESVIARIETKLGRLKPWIVVGTHFLNIEMEAIRATVEAGQHFKEAVGLNFRTIPDPFESYIKNLNSKEIVDFPSESRDPRGKPGIDLSVPFTAAAIKTSSGETSLESLEKNNVMNRIANLRKEISKDELRLESQKKLREEVVLRDRRAGPSAEEEKETVDILSDDEPQPASSRDLRLRKPERRGIRSRNPDGKSSRIERDSKIPERELYMDRVERDKTTDKSDRRSPARRSRKRSRSKSRSRSRSRRRARSVSPFVCAMENWKKFKKAEAAMLSEIGARRSGAERRPEDHPKYGEEWKYFWEKRYKELQSQGRDPNRHDFKAEWIPYWTKRVSRLFDNEVLEKTNDLMNKYHLASVAEPKREDFRPGRTRKSRSKDRRSRSRSRGRHKAARRSRSGSGGRRRRRSGSELGRSSVRREDRNEVSRDREQHQQEHFNPFGEDRRDVRDLRNSGRAGDRFGGAIWEQQEKQQSVENHQARGPTLFPVEVDMYSGITELEDRRDRGRTVTPARPQSEDLVPCVRLLTALEDTLGSLGPPVNQVLARALSLEQGRAGSSAVLLEDPDTVSLLEMVKEKLTGLAGARLVSGSREGAVRVSLDHLGRILEVATKKRSANISSYLSPQPGPSSVDQQEMEKNKTLIASTLATSLLQSGQQDITDAELLVIVEQVLQVTAEEDPRSSLGRFSKTLLQVTDRENSLARSTEGQFNSYDLVRAERVSGGVIPLVTIEDREPSGSLDHLTTGELKSLLANFKTLSNQEQGDLVNYMKVLENTNPEKARNVKEVVRSPGGGEEGRRQGWSPPMTRRTRRLSGSDLEINPVNPEADWESERSREVFTQNNFRPIGGDRSQSHSGMRPEENPFQRAAGPGGGHGGRGEEGEVEGIPLKPLYRQPRYQKW